jgi:hypothetical protein
LIVNQNSPSGTDFTQGCGVSNGKENRRRLICPRRFGVRRL